MDKNSFNENLQKSENADNQAGTNEMIDNSEETTKGSLFSSGEEEENETDKLRAEIEELKDKYIRLVADFDNYRKRNAKERLELIQMAGKDVISSLLEVLDDCDRAEKQIQQSNDISTIKEGILLVFNKLRNVLQQKGLRSMQTIGFEFSPDQHEAITEIPSPTPELKGKILDEVEKGYYLNDRIIRFAKVVVGK